jgi:hypothetical protein
MTKTRWFVNNDRLLVTSSSPDQVFFRDEDGLVVAPLESVLEQIEAGKSSQVWSFDRSLPGSIYVTWSDSFQFEGGDGTTRDTLVSEHLMPERIGLQYAVMHKNQLGILFGPETRVRQVVPPREYVENNSWSEKRNLYNDEVYASLNRRILNKDFPWDVCAEYLSCSYNWNNINARSGLFSRRDWQIHDREAPVDAVRDWAKSSGFRLHTLVGQYDWESSCSMLSRDKVEYCFEKTEIHISNQEMFKAAMLLRSVSVSALKELGGESRFEELSTRIPDFSLTPRLYFSPEAVDCMMFQPDVNNAYRQISKVTCRSEFDFASRDIALAVVEMRRGRLGQAAKSLKSSLSYFTDAPVDADELINMGAPELKRWFLGEPGNEWCLSTPVIDAAFTGGIDSKSHLDFLEPFATTDRARALIHWGFARYYSSQDEKWQCTDHLTKAEEYSGFAIEDFVYSAMRKDPSDIPPWFDLSYRSHIRVA